MFIIVLAIWICVPLIMKGNISVDGMLIFNALMTLSMICCFLFGELVQIKKILMEMHNGNRTL